MINGGLCTYSGGSQLAAAASFLRAHRARVSLVTIDIGANDADGCISQLSFSRITGCVRKSLPQATTNLTTIMKRLRQADPHGRIIAMSYYLPSLAQWRNGPVGHAVARVSVLAMESYNTLLTRVYQGFGVRVADVFGAFHSTDFGQQVTVPGFGTLPRNVAAICQWTWECAAPPRGPNVHANPAGYQVIAGAFLRAGASAPRPRR
jgi:lysophospholipase L1-like esterase